MKKNLIQKTEEFLEILNPRIETKIAVKKIINTKYLPSEKIYAQINSKLNIPKYN